MSAEFPSRIPRLADRSADDQPFHIAQQMRLILESYWILLRANSGKTWIITSQVIGLEPLSNQTTGIAKLVGTTVSDFGLPWDLLDEIDFLISSYSLTYS